MKKPNPQGKGTDLLVNHWHPPVLSQHKPIDTIIKDYFQSLLVLSARLPFKPVIHQHYYLYVWQEELRLSLIEPQKLNHNNAEYLAHCQLREDLTWQIKFSDSPLSQSALDFLEQFYNGFVAHLDTDAKLVDLLPFYQQGLGYHARVFANGLSKSLAISMPKQQNAPVSARQCLALLRDGQQQLLPLQN